MEKKITLHIEKLPEGYFLATSESIQGLVAQGRTISKTVEIAKDLAKKLIEAQENLDINHFSSFENEFDLAIAIGI